MNIEATKLELMHLLLQTQKESILKKLKSVFEEEQVDWWSEMSKKEQEEIKTGLAQADKGEYNANETVMKRFDKWH
jgi:predicted transcriptional regulator